MLGRYQKSSPYTQGLYYIDNYSSPRDFSGNDRHLTCTGTGFGAKYKISNSALLYGNASWARTSTDFKFVAGGEYTISCFLCGTGTLYYGAFVRVHDVFGLYTYSPRSIAARMRKSDGSYITSDSYDIGTSQRVHHVCATFKTLQDGTVDFALYGTLIRTLKTDKCNIAPFYFSNIPAFTWRTPSYIFEIITGTRYNTNFKVGEVTLENRYWTQTDISNYLSLIHGNHAPNTFGFA